MVLERPLSAPGSSLRNDMARLTGCLWLPGLLQLCCDERSSAFPRGRIGYFGDVDEISASSTSWPRTKKFELEYGLYAPEVAQVIRDESNPRFSA